MQLRRSETTLLLFSEGVMLVLKQGEDFSPNRVDM